MSKLAQFAHADPVLPQMGAGAHWSGCRVSKMCIFPPKWLKPDERCAFVAVLGCSPEPRTGAGWAGLGQNTGSWPCPGANPCCELFPCTQSGGCPVPSPPGASFGAPLGAFFPQLQQRSTERSSLRSKRIQVSPISCCHVCPCAFAEQGAWRCAGKSL